MISMTADSGLGFLGGAAAASVVEFDKPEGAAGGTVRIGVHRQGALPNEGLDEFDVLLSAKSDAPRPWVGLEALDTTLAALIAAIERQPAAAAILAQVLRIGALLPFKEALTLESLAYSTLLNGSGFRNWRASRPARAHAKRTARRVEMARCADGLSIRLARPEARNAFDAAMRDALVEALEFSVIDPDKAPVRLSGEGPDFSAGGDLDEFGQAGDAAAAHLIRTLHSPTRLIHAVRSRVSAELHGACIGAGIEIPAAAGFVAARPGAYFRLPELSMGLIPGAGGTVTISRRIGRWRTCYLALLGCDLGLETALAWGLVDALSAAP